MIRHSIVFIATFVVGAVVALATRAALHDPHPDVTVSPAPEQSAMVHHPLVPAEKPAPAVPHGEKSTDGPPAASRNVPVNTVCAICGMDVDPSIPTAEYQGKTIGFGCRMCPSKFKANPDKYGPAYLRNEVL